MIIQILAATFTGVYISYISGIGRRIGYRPFNCPMCLSAWLGAALFFIPELVSVFLCTMFVPGVVAALFTKITDKWLFNS